MGCKFERTADFDVMQEYVGTKKAYEIINKLKDVPRMGYKLNGEKDTNFDLFTKKFGFKDGARMWYNTFLNDYVEFQSDDTGVFFNQDGSPKYFIPENVDKYGWQEMRSSRDADLLRLSQEMGKYKGRVAVSKFMDRISMMTGVNTIRETNETSKAKGRSNEKAWVDNVGIHINTDLVTPDTYIHEVGHVWLYGLKSTDPDAYRMIMTMTRENMESTPLFSNIIAEKYNVSGDRLVEEYFCTVTGLMTYDSVLTELNKSYEADTSIDAAGTVFNNIRNYIAGAYKIVRDSLFKNVTPSIKDIDLSTARFYDVIAAIKNDFVEGRSIFSKREMEDIWVEMNNDSSLREFPYASLDLNNATPVMKAGDFTTYLVGDKVNDNNIGMNIMSNEQKAEYIINNMKNDGDKLIYYYQGKQYTFKNNLTRENLRAEVIRTVIPAINEYKKSVETEMDLFLRRFDPMDNIEEQTEEFIKKYKLNKYQFYEMIRLSGLNDSFVSIMKYSDLQKSDNKKLKALYNEAFVGTDPYIIVHDDKGKMTISLLDFTTDNINGFNVGSEAYNLFHEIGLNNDEYRRLGGTLQNDNEGIRMFLNGLTIMNMVKQGVKINTISIFTIPNGGMESRVMLSVEELFNNYKILRDNDKLASFRSMIKSDAIMNIIKDDKMYDGSHNVSWMSILKTYVNSVGDTYGEHASLHRMFLGTKVSEYDMKKTIRRRMSAIQAKYPGSTFRLYEDIEYRMLSRAYAELTKMPKRAMTNVRDSSRIERRFGVTHTVPTFFQQYIKEQYDNTLFLIVDEMRNALQRTADVRRKAFDIARKRMVNVSDGAKLAGTFLFDSGSNVFEKMFKSVDGEDASGNKIKIRLPFVIHYDINDPDTKQALRNNDITKEEVEYGSTIVAEIEDRCVRNIMHNASMNGNDMTYESARKEFLSLMDSRNVPFSTFIPVVQKSSTEMLMSLVDKKSRKEMAKKWYEKKKEDFSNDNELFNEVTLTGKDDKLDRVGSIFLKQMYSFSDMLNLCGMVMTEAGTFKIIDQAKYDSLSSNIELIFNSFMLSSARKEHIESQFIPAYNTTKVMMDIYKKTAKEDSLENAEKWIDVFKERMIDRSSIKLSNEFRGLYALEGMMTKFYSTAVLGYYAPVAMKSLGLNTIQAIIKTHSTTMAQKIKKDGNQSTLPTTEDFWWASMLVFSGPKKNTDKLFTLGRDFQLIDSSERDMINNPVNVFTKRYLGNEQNKQIANWMTDNLSRVLAMASQMHKDGTWEAYVYDEKTGRYHYDYTKDKRYQTDEGKAILKYILDDNKALGLESQDATIETMKHGYNVSETKKMKFYADMYIVGAMTEDVKAQIATEMFARSIFQFKWFSFVKLNRFGIGATAHDTVLGTGIKAYKDEDGDWVSEREIRSFVTEMNEWGKMFKALGSFKGKNIKEWWEGTSEEGRTALTQTLTKSVITVLLFLTFMAFRPEDKTYREYYKHLRSKYRWIWADMMDFSILSDIYKNPITYFNFSYDLYSAVFTDAPWYKMFRYIPIVNTANSYDLIISQEEKDEIEKERRKNREAQKKILELEEQEELEN